MQRFNEKSHDECRPTTACALRSASRAPDFYQQMARAIA